MQFLWKWIEDFIGKGLEWVFILEVLGYTSASLIPMALPLAVLLASVMTFGNLGEHYELTAMKSAGISLQRIMRPLIVIIVSISVAAFFFSNNVLPYSNLKMATLLYDVTHKRPEVNIKEGVFNNDIEGYSIKVGRKSKTSIMMYDFMIYNHTSRTGNPEVTLADSGEIKFSPDRKNMMINLYSGQSFNEIYERRGRELQYPHRRDEFDNETIMFDLSGFDMQHVDSQIFKNNFRMMTLEQLTQVIDSLKLIYNQRKEKAGRRIVEFNYFKFENKIYNTIDTPLILADSLRKYAPVDKLISTTNLDSLYESLNDYNKQKAINLAKDYVTKSISNIETGSKDIYERGKWIRKHELEWYRKFSLSFACIIFFFIGAPLGAIIRKGGFGMPFLVSTLMFMIYYIISVVGEKFVREDVMPVFIGSWLSSAVLFPLGFFLTYKATRDSALLNTEAYSEFFKKVINIFKKKKKTA